MQTRKHIYKPHEHVPPSLLLVLLLPCFHTRTHEQQALQRQPRLLLLLLQLQVPHQLPRLTQHQIQTCSALLEGDGEGDLAGGQKRLHYARHLKVDEGKTNRTHI
jgi:hypothetical protein